MAKGEVLSPSSSNSFRESFFLSRRKQMEFSRMRAKAAMTMNSIVRFGAPFFQFHFQLLRDSIPLLCFNAARTKSSSVF